MKLIFVYNTRLKPLSLLNDFVNEVIPFKEANCKLCDITYSLAWKKRKWKDYLESLDIDHEFFFIEEFEKNYHPNEDCNYPCVYLYDSANKDLQILLSSSNIAKMETIEDLINQLNILLSDEKM